MPAHLLVVEDDQLQQAVLKSAFERRGYSVDVASDGLTAVRMLRAGGYDLALIDYHLPEIDGFASARLLRDLMSEEDRPRLIAVTATSDSLSLRDASSIVFDAIVPKSLELPALFSIVETHLRATAGGQTANGAEAAWRELGLAGLPAVMMLPLPSAAQTHLLRHYFDLSGCREPEAVLLLGPEAIRDAIGLRVHSPRFTLPIIDLTGCLAGADAVFSATDRSTWNAVASAIIRFAKGRTRLGGEASNAADLETRLLSYVFLSGRPLQPAADFASRECVRYPGFFPHVETRPAAERLASRGLLERRFFERFHVCGHCGSFRLNVREECLSCHSANLRDVAVIHHYRCAHQAPETDFARGIDLICPKCRRQLNHFGRDYGKPGKTVVCGDCGACGSEPAIGFACLDCGGRTAGDAAEKLDIFSYSLTIEGNAVLQRGALMIEEPHATKPGVA